MRKMKKMFPAIHKTSTPLRHMVGGVDLSHSSVIIIIFYILYRFLEGYYSSSNCIIKKLSTILICIYTTGTLDREWPKSFFWGKSGIAHQI